MSNVNFFIILVSAFVLVTVFVVFDPFDISDGVKIAANGAFAGIYGALGYLAMRHNTAEARGYFCLATLYLFVGVMLMEPQQLLHNGPDPVVPAEWETDWT